MKRILSFMLAAALLLTLAGCGASTTEAAETETKGGAGGAIVQEENYFDFGDVHYTLHLPVYELTYCRMESGGELLSEFRYSDFVYNEKGQLVSQNESEWENTYEYEYDDQGRMIRETERDWEGDWYTYTYEYYEDTINDYGDFHHAWNHPSMGGLLKKLTRRSNIEFYDNYVCQYDYEFDDQGRVTKETSIVWADYYRNDYYYEYNELGQIVREREETFYEASDRTPGSWHDYTLTYNAVGLLVRMEGTSCYSWDDYPEKDVITYEYGAGTYREVSTETDSALLTTDNWEGFEERKDMPTPTSCVGTISYFRRDLENGAILHTYTMPEEQREAYETFNKYQAILSEVCGFTLEMEDDVVYIYDGEEGVGVLTYGYDPACGFFMQVGFSAEEQELNVG